MCVIITPSSKVGNTLRKEEDMDRADIAVIGTGPAGISAAINARIRRKSFLLFGSSKLSAKIESSEQIVNYPAIDAISGPQLNERFREQLVKLEIPIIDERITGIYKMENYYLIMADQKQYEASTVIIATGVETVRALPGERKMLGRGVSYCATCDGRLYEGRRIAVLCDNSNMEDEVDYLCSLAGEVVYFPLFNSDMKRDNLVMAQSRMKAVKGTDYVECVELQDGSTIAVDGVFMLKQSVSADVLLHGLDVSGGHIVTDRNMATNMPGCYAAGDCTGTPYQISKAVGEGNIAAHSAIAYLGRRNSDD